MPDKTILLVEDDFMNMRLAQHVLEQDGCSVLRAATAREALLQLESTIPALILMDMQLPDIDGLTLVKLIREKQGTRHIIILALTACAMKGDRERMLQMGCDGYISKPIDVQAFLSTVRRFLGEET